MKALPLVTVGLSQFQGSTVSTAGTTRRALRFALSFGGAHSRDANDLRCWLAPRREAHPRAVERVRARHVRRNQSSNRGAAVADHSAANPRRYFSIATRGISK